MFATEYNQPLRLLAVLVILSLGKLCLKLGSFHLVVFISKLTVANASFFIVLLNEAETQCFSDFVVVFTSFIHAKRAVSCTSFTVKSGHISFCEVLWICFSLGREGKTKYYNLIKSLKHTDMWSTA